MDELFLRKIEAYIPYQRWIVKIVKWSKVEYSELFSTEKDAMDGCCEWYLKKTGATYDYEAVVTDLGQLGFQVIICEA
jgi:hypothetical protein